MRKNMARAAVDLPGIRDSKTFTDDGGTFSVSVTDMDFRAGDLGVIVFTQGNTNATHANITDWTERFSDGGTLRAAEIHTKVMDGTETSVVSTSGHAQACTSGILFFVNGHDYTALTSDGPSSGFPNPPSITSVVATDIVLVTAHIDGANGTFTAPSGYTLIGTEGHSYSTAHSTTGVAWATGLSGTVNPGAWGGLSSGTNYSTTIRLGVE